MNLSSCISSSNHSCVLANTAGSRGFMSLSFLAFIPKGLLTYNEIVIFINIANNYIGRDNEKALAILYELRKYMDTHVLDRQEKMKKYQVIIFNLSSILLEEKRYDEVMELCDSGIKSCKENNRLRLFPYFFLNKGFALLGKRKIEQAQIQLKKGYNVLDAMGAEKECRRLVVFLKENWNVTDLL